MRGSSTSASRSKNEGLSGFAGAWSGGCVVDIPRLKACDYKVQVYFQPRTPRWLKVRTGSSQRPMGTAATNSSAPTSMPAASGWVCVLMDGAGLADDLCGRRDLALAVLPPDGLAFMTSGFRGRRSDAGATAKRRIRRSPEQGHRPPRQKRDERRH